MVGPLCFVAEYVCLNAFDSVRDAGNGISEWMRFYLVSLTMTLHNA